jgi:site-specific recombinase XerD
MTAWLDGRYARDEITAITRSGYQLHIAAFVAHVGHDRPLADITVETIEAWIGSLTTRAGRPLAPSARNTKVATIRVFFAWATERGLINRDPTLQIRRARTPKRPPRRVAVDQVALVLAAAPFRARIMITLAVQMMLRRSEIAALQVEDWDRKGGFLYVRGKGAKDRNLPLTEEATEALTAWLADGRQSGPMWPSPHGKGLSVRTVAQIISSAAAGVGLKINPHAYRHTGASDAVLSGASLDAVRRTLGHASLNTTTIYVDTRPEELRGQIEGRRYRAVG